MYDPELEKRVSKLREASGYEETEIGETWRLMADIFDGLQESYVSEEFVEAFRKEIDAHLNNLESNYKWVEEEQEVTRKEKVRELVYIDDMQ